MFSPALTPNADRVPVTENDEYNSTVQQALRSGDTAPEDMAERIENINQDVFNKLKTHHDRSVTSGYFQSHPYSPMFTAKDLAVDELTLSNNYMRIIFGGETDEEKDNIHLAYKHAAKQFAEAPTMDANTMFEMKPSDFVEGAQATKESLLQTFQEARQYYKGVVDTDTERALKQRPTHDLIHTTYYDKGNRFHLIAGQHGHLQFRPDTKNFYPTQNLSSKNFAPMPDGTEVPLNTQNVFGEDPRQVPIDVQPKLQTPSQSSTYNFNDAGMYYGAEIDRYVTDYTEKNPTFDSQFRVANQRRWL